MKRRDCKQLEFDFAQGDLCGRREIARAPAPQTGCSHGSDSDDCPDCRH